ncbi:MAG: helix-turn-helix domain-containing protein [Acidimicrobiales bacterium]
MRRTTPRRDLIEAKDGAAMALAQPVDGGTALWPGEVAELFGVSPKTVGRWADAGRLPVERTSGGHRRFPISGVLALRAAGEGGWGASRGTE